MKSLLGVIMLLTSFFAPNSDAFVIASRCMLYTEASFTSSIVQFEDAPVELTQGDRVTINGEEGDFVLVTTSSNQQGYVYKYYLSQNSDQSTYPVFNCTVRQDTIIHSLDKNPTTYLALKGDRVFIYAGFDKIDGGYTAVQVVLEDGSLYNGLISSKDLKPDGVNRTVIIAIPLIMAGVTVILSIVFLKKKNNKKKKKLVVNVE